MRGETLLDDCTLTTPGAFGCALDCWMEPPKKKILQQTPPIPVRQEQTDLTSSQSHASAARKQGPRERPATLVVSATGGFTIPTEGQVLTERQGQRRGEAGWDLIKDQWRSPKVKSSIRTDSRVQWSPGGQISALPPWGWKLHRNWEQNLIQSLKLQETTPAVVSQGVMCGSQDLCWRLVSLSESHKFHNLFRGGNKCQGILMLRSERTN